jgi:two-component system cell cycle response regulator
MAQHYNYKKENLLVVDDEIETGKAVRDLLVNMGFSADFISEGRNALHKLKKETYTLLITDINMPELDGIQLIKRVKREAPTINVIAMTGDDRKYTFMDVIDAGADDFITKPFKVEEMEAKIMRVLIERQIKDELARLSITDNLTGLFNQRHFYNRLREEIGRTNRLNHPLSLILLDLDNFKDYNDRYGHLAGDRMLARCAKTIRSNIRANVDIAFRYGGDEFAVILVEADNDIADNISTRLKNGFKQGGGVTASIGFATYSKEMSLNDFIELADKNLYLTKNKGG